jgi:hypothetical protein
MGGDEGVDVFDGVIGRRAVSEMEREMERPRASI